MRAYAAGRYQALGEIARGRYATIYRATDANRPGEEVALKVLELDGSHRDLSRAMFRKEVEALRAIDHPRIVKLLDSFEEPGTETLVLVLELVPGENLEQRIRRGGTVPPLRWRLKELVALVDAIDAAHRKSVIHRDVKPSNVLVDRDLDELRLADFGIARVLENYGRTTPGVTLAHFFTRPYAAPEQIFRGDAEPASDLHAFGMLAAAVLAWELPTEDMRAEDLPAFLAPLADHVRDEKLVDVLVALVRGLLGGEARMRPRVPEILRVLNAVLDRTVERRSVRVVLTNAVSRGLERLGITNAAAALDDLSSQLRARYEPQQGADARSPFSILAYGRRLRARLTPAVEADRLLVVELLELEPSAHARERQRAKAAPFALTLEGGSPDPFVQALFEAHREDERQLADRRRRESLVELARTINELMSEQLPSWSLRYRLVEERPTQRLGDLLRAKLGTASPSAPDPAPRTARITGEFVRLEIKDLLDDEVDDDTRAAMLANWHDAVNQKATVSTSGMRIGSFHSYDPSTRVLTVRRDADLTGLPTEEVIEVFDLQSKAAIDRVGRALSDFERGEVASASLGSLLTLPERNRLDPLVPRTLHQPLEPADRANDLVCRILAARDFFLLQGPPGTGKTTVIAEVVTHILAEQPTARVLLTSQANEAVDHAIGEARALAAKLARPSRMFRDTAGERIDDGPPNDPAYGTWLAETKKASADGFASLAASLPDPQREAVRRVVERWQDRMGTTRDVRVDYLSSVQVIGATCLRVPAVAKYLRDGAFDWVIVDEAARATTAEVMVALVRGRRFLLVGDQKQLPPYLAHQTARDLRDHEIDPERAKRSLFEDIFELIPKSNRESLRRQFRMHRSIAKVIGDLFYGEIGGLETGVADEDRTIALAAFDAPHRIFWLDVRGTEEPLGTSWYNDAEIDLVVSTLGAMNTELAAQAVAYDVAVIAAYKAQAVRLQRAIKARASAWHRLRVQAATVDAFQGKQADVVIYSLARVGDEEVRFLANPHRINVAFSRAKRLVVVVGHAETARRSALFARLLDMIPPSNVRAAGGAS
jgi:serine/threonine protein kinase/DNA polymerase III delta prime subunit